MLLSQLPSIKLELKNGSACGVKPSVKVEGSIIKAKNRAPKREQIVSFKSSPYENRKCFEGLQIKKWPK